MIMKRFSFLFLTILVVMLGTSQAAEPGGVIDLQGLPTPNVLSLYQKMSGLELVIDSRARQVESPITLKAGSPITKSDLLKLVEKTLIEQAAIVITKLDDKRASVTFNDALLKLRPTTGVHSQSPGK